MFWWLYNRGTLIFIWLLWFIHNVLPRFVGCTTVQRLCLFYHYNLFILFSKIVVVVQPCPSTGRDSDNITMIQFLRYWGEVEWLCRHLTFFFKLSISKEKSSEERLSASPDPASSNDEAVSRWDQIRSWRSCRRCWWLGIAYRGDDLFFNIVEKHRDWKVQSSVIVTLYAAFHHRIVIDRFFL